MTAEPPLLLRLDLTAPRNPAASPPGVVIRALRPEEAPAAHALMQLAYAKGGGSVPASFHEWWGATSTDEEFDPALCLVAEATDGIAGFALCWTSSFVKDLVVHPEYRRRGIGEALLGAAAAAMAARGHDRLSLKVEASNDGARRLYERAGFRPA